MVEDSVDFVTLIGRFTHDIRSPLSIVSNEAELLSMELGSERVRELKAALNKALEMLRDLDKSAGITGA